MRAEAMNPDNRRDRNLTPRWIRWFIPLMLIRKQIAVALIGIVIVTLIVVAMLGEMDAGPASYLVLFVVILFGVPLGVVAAISVLSVLFALFARVVGLCFACPSCDALTVVHSKTSDAVAGLYVCRTCGGSFPRVKWRLFCWQWRSSR